MVKLLTREFFGDSGVLVKELRGFLLGTLVHSSSHFKEPCRRLEVEAGAPSHGDHGWPPPRDGRRLLRPTMQGILYCTILYYTILYYIILYYTILYYTILYYTILYYTILYYTILCYTILYSTLPYYSGHPQARLSAWKAEAVTQSKDVFGDALRQGQLPRPKRCSKSPNLPL